MDPETFKNWPGRMTGSSPDEIRKAVEAAVPESRKRLLPSVRQHADSLTTSFDMIDETHRQAGQKLADWIAKNYRPGQPLDVDRGLHGQFPPEHPRGDDGQRRRRLLRDAGGPFPQRRHGPDGVQCPHGERARGNRRRSRADRQGSGAGEPKTANPVYRVRWGTSGERAGRRWRRRNSPSITTIRPIPQQGFAALMVCGEADAACPFVKGAALRVSMPYLDPKIYDGGAYESAKYAERRDDMGRLMLAVMMQARQAWLRFQPTRREGAVMALSP